jgi:hypothetical protein
MADSEWESIRKKFRNRVRFGVGIGIPVVLLAGFLFYNNRDLFSNSEQSEDAVKRADTTIVKSLTDTVVSDQGDQARHVIDSIRDTTVKKQDLVVVKKVHEDKKVIEKKVVEKSPGNNPAVINVPVIPVETVPDILLELSSIRCRTADQNGPILNLSVELKRVHGGAVEKKILMMRDEFRVLIQNVVRNTDISTLNQEQLKTEIIQSINKYIGDEVFNDLKFAEFKVEKVIKK